MLKNNRIARSFIVQVADLIFHINPHTLTVSDGTTTLSTQISSDEIGVLKAFADQAKTVTSPLPKSEVIYSIVDGPQKISLIKKGNDHILMINSQVQFTANSEVIYHEALVHPAFGSVHDPKTCLILGGGDGLAAKQIFKYYPDTKITLVDFDKNITDIFTYDPVMMELNESSMEKCTVINDDAFEYVKNDDNKYDVIICDFPDPDTDIFNKLYSIELYSRLKEMLTDDGAMVVQSGSLVPDAKCFPCIKKTLEAAGFQTKSYYTPSTYGELVYNLCKKSEAEAWGVQLVDGLQATSQEFFDSAMCNFRPGLISKEEVEVNTVDNMVALEYRLEELEQDKR